MDHESVFAEHFVPSDQGRLYARDYPGAEPAFVLMHGFPDNSHIYDSLVPYLTAAGRRVVTFDFLGFGASDKPEGAVYSFEQQLGDLKAVVAALGLRKIVPVAHDASGAAAVNYTLAHPAGVDSLIMLNSAYADDAAVPWPEMITLFATPGLSALAAAMAQSPEQFGWLMNWQQKKFFDVLSEEQKLRTGPVLTKLIVNNFMQPPSAGPAFFQITFRFFDALIEDAKHLPELATLEMPVKLIWGERDPYLNVAMAKRRQLHFKDASLTLIPAGHWLQIDEPEATARAMLA